MKQIVAPFLVFLSLNCFSQQPKPVTAVPKINQVYTTPPDSLYLNVGGTNGFHNLARYKEVKRLNDSVAALRSGINLKLNKSDTASLSQRINLKAPLASPTFTGTVSGITKAMVGLGSVDNTTDAGKPISTLTQTALNLKADKTNGLISTGGISLVGTTVTITAPIVWFINGVTYTKATNSVFTINSATAGFYREDLIYATTSSTLIKLEGAENASAAIEPTLPAGTIKVSVVDVFGSD